MKIEKKMLEKVPFPIVNHYFCNPQENLIEVTITATFKSFGHGPAVPYHSLYEMFFKIHQHRQQFFKFFLLRSR